VSPKPSGEEYRRELGRYQEMVELMKEGWKVQVVPWGETWKQVLKTFESLISNPKIYW
jgi:hypothetical protein